MLVSSPQWLFVRNKTLDLSCVCLICSNSLTKTSFTLCCLLIQDVTFVSVSTDNHTVLRKFESLFGTAVSFNFRHISILLSFNYLLVFGARNISIFLPSSFAGFSTTAVSLQASANRFIVSRPISGCPISRPLKRIETLTLSPCLINFRALLSFVLKSCVSILRESLTSLISTTLWFFLASFSLLAWSNRYFQ